VKVKGESRNLVGRGSRKAARVTRENSSTTIDLMRWVYKRAEACPNTGPRLGASIGLTHRLNWYPLVSLGETCGLAGASPHQVTGACSNLSLFTFHVFLSQAALDRRGFLLLIDLFTPWRQEQGAVKHVPLYQEREMKLSLRFFLPPAFPICLTTRFNR
jgi:hypothetical protein